VPVGFEIQIDVQGEAVLGDPVLNVHPYRDDLRPPDPDAGVPLVARPFDPLPGEHKHAHPLYRAYEIAHAQYEIGYPADEIAYELPRGSS